MSMNISGNQDLVVYFLVDCSDSMQDELSRIERYINEIVPSLQAVNKSYPRMKMKARVLRFSSTSAFFSSQTALNIDNFSARALISNGQCAVSKAYDQLVQQFKGADPKQGNATPPVMILISDGHFTDDYQQSLKALKALPMYRLGIRMAFTPGQNINRQALLDFTGLEENIRPLNKFEAMLSIWGRGR